MVRYGGADRYATAVTVSRAAFPTGSSPDTVYVATGEAFADALSASAAAAATNGAVLLTPRDRLPASRLDRIAAEDHRLLAPGRRPRHDRRAPTAGRQAREQRSGHERARHFRSTHHERPR